MARSLTTAWNGSAFSLTPTQIKNWVSHVNCSPTIIPRFKLLNAQNFVPYNTGYTGPYGDSGDISKWVDRAAVKNDTSQKVHRSLDVEFIQSPNGFTYNPLTDAIQVFLAYWNGNPDEGGTFLFEVPLGVFLFTIPDLTITDSSVLGAATMGDFASRCLMPFMNTYVVASGVNFLDAVKALLSVPAIPVSQGGAGRTPSNTIGTVNTGGLDLAGPAVREIVVDAVTPVAQDAVTPSTLAFTRDNNFLDSAGDPSTGNGLLDAISYYPPWFDGMGVCHLTPRPNLSQQIPTYTWTYHTDASSIIHPGVVHKPVNFADLANALTVYSENPNVSTGGFSSTVFNNKNNLSSLCISNIGYVIYKVFKLSKIPDQASCNFLAYVKLLHAAALADQVDFKTWPSPFATDAHEYVDLNVTDINGNALVSSPTGFEELSWELDLNTREHTHTVGKMLLL